MSASVEVLFTPAEFEALNRRDLSRITCIVFDVLRATTSMVTALAAGAEAILPVKEISEAVSAKQRDRSVLLAGEREGRRIEADLAGGTAFDLGNSPREFTPATVRGRRIVMTTTNGTRALRACAGAERVLAASFLNLSATLRVLNQRAPANLLLVCSGTYEQAAYEDIICAGAFCDMLGGPSGNMADSAQAALRVFLAERGDLAGAMVRSRNARRLLGAPDLREDVAWCLQRDVCDLPAALCPDGWVRQCS